MLFYTKKIRKGDTVRILSGRDKGKTGKVLDVLKDGKISVEGLNLVTRHRKPRKAREKGQKMVKPSFVDLSKAMLVCPNCGKASKVGFSVAESGEKSRVCKNCKRSV
jgi:large subunit ribosomal protein L24